MRSAKPLAFMKSLVATIAAVGAILTTAAPGDGPVLKSKIVAAYPSLEYVERYRASFPREIQGGSPFWLAASPHISNARQLVDALSQLQDQHVSLMGPRAGKAETLGALFRSSTDGHVIVWRVFDRSAHSLRRGDVVIAVDGTPASTWLTQAASRTFGGNRRSRAAEAALDLGLGTKIVHSMDALRNTVHLRVKSASTGARDVVLRYEPMNETRASALAAAVNQADLPATIRSNGYRIGTVRIGAFAPQYDPVFNAAADKASKMRGTSDDQAMLAGFCAVTRSFMARYDRIARSSDVMVLDLRGNMGGFGRLAQLEARAIAPGKVSRTFDLSATSKSGVVQLAQEHVDPSCGHVAVHRPLVVLVDAGTRSAGELMATWLWTAGATLVGERTIGAGGGLGYQSAGFALPSGFRVAMSASFTVFDPARNLKPGNWPEKVLISRLASRTFAPSRTHPFAIQAVGIRPDVPLASSLADLLDGGTLLRRLYFAKRRNAAAISDSE